MSKLNELLNRDKELSGLFWNKYHNNSIIIDDAIMAIDRKDRLIELLLKEVNKNENN